MKMRITTAFLLGVISVISISAAIDSPSVAVEDCEPGLYHLNKENYLGGTVVSNSRVCPQIGTLDLHYSAWVNGVLTESRNATIAEQTDWIMSAKFAASSLELQQSEGRLNAEVEDGKKIVALLNEWSMTYAGYYETWPTLSDAQKDNANRQHLRHFSVLLSKLADLYVISDQGR